MQAGRQAGASKTTVIFTNKQWHTVDRKSVSTRINFQFPPTFFLFHGLECVFHLMEHIFHWTERTFHGLELKTHRGKTTFSASCRTLQ